VHVRRVFSQARRLLPSTGQREVHMYYGAGGILLLIVLILLLTGRL
jgi:LPXTG-motif cell wall-anchored protein